MSNSSRIICCERGVLSAIAIVPSHQNPYNGGLVKGHDFSRAKNPNRSKGASAPEGFQTFAAKSFQAKLPNPQISALSSRQNGTLARPFLE
jgi:hypothetical protein